jgi:mRNA-degrading endonuclease RelE of RelBE toxin-antitoxin system
MYRVEISSRAEQIIRDVPGLYQRAREMLVGILETAEQIRFLGDSYFLPDSVMRLRVGNFELSYTLDLNRGSAAVLSAERISDDVGPRSTDS